MTRVGIDDISTGESTLPGGPGGMRTYLREMINGIAQSRPQWQLVVFTPKGGPALMDALPANVTMAELPGVPHNRGLRVLYQQFIFPVFIARWKIGAFFAAASIAPLWTGARVVLAVQFLQFFLPRSKFSLRSAYLRRLLPASVKKATRVIAFSEAASADLIAATAVAKEKVTIIPHGIPEEVWEFVKEPQRAAGVGLALTGGRPYILYVSATYEYKNHLRLIRAFAQLKREMSIPHALLLAGSEVTVPFAELKAEAARQSVANDVIIPGRVASAAALYFDASLAVFPSIQETFGFPLVEAMACGCAVVTSNVSSMCELAGDAALLVDPLDENSIASGMKVLLRDEGMRDRLRAKGVERAAQYTWARAVESTVKVIEQALAG